MMLMSVIHMDWHMFPSPWQYDFLEYIFFISNLTVSFDVICRVKFLPSKFQIGAIYMWSYVYNIMRIYSSKDCEVPKVEAFAKVAKSPRETPENLSKVSTGPLLPLQGHSPNEDHIDHFELDCAMSKRKAEVV